jgi:hypothetical protein
MANIDSQINDRMQTYSGNPQALQQRYAQTQELVDLLALQKMKNDRAAATSAVQGAMQTDTNTYKGQLEQEAMQGARNDILRSMAPGIQQQGQQLAQMQNRAAVGMPTTGLPAQPAPNMRGMAMGGIVGYQQGGGVKRFQEGMAVISDDESRFGVTTDSGMSPEEAVAMDMQGPEAQRPKFGDELGGIIEEGVADAIQLIKDNPLEAASLASLAIPLAGPGISAGLRGAGLVGRIAGPIFKKYGTKAGTKILERVRPLISKPNPKAQYYPGVKPGDLTKAGTPYKPYPTMKNGRPTATPPTVISPLKATGLGLGTLGLGAAGVKRLMGGEGGETELPQNEGITAGMYDVRSGMPTPQQKLGSMVNRPSAVLRDNMAGREAAAGKPKSELDLRPLREFLVGGAGQTSTAGALAGGARGLGAFQAAEQARADTIQQAANELQLKRDLAANEAAMLDRKLLAEYQGKLTTAEIGVVQDILEQLNDPLSATGAEYNAKATAIRDEFKRDPVVMEEALIRLKKQFLQQGLNAVRQSVLGGAPSTSAQIAGPASRISE